MRAFFIYQPRQLITIADKIEISLGDNKAGQWINTELSGDKKSILFKYPCKNNICTFYNLSIKQGIYKFELWGASGGYNEDSPEKGGHGAYTSGYLTIYNQTNFFLYLGQQGCKFCQNIYNGGGNGPITPRDGYSGSGGGASDIRLKAASWSEFESLKSRIMVAAGGGGSVFYKIFAQGGHGGSLIGLDGSCSSSSDSNCDNLTLALGGNQTNPGKSGTSTIEYRQPKDAIFGAGGYPTNANFGAGGGGGYFGGGAGAIASGAVGSGAGGSSFISGMDGCVAIDESSTVNRIIPSNQSVHYSNIQFISTKMISGDFVGYNGN